MIAQRKNLALDKAASFKQGFRYYEADNTPYDLTNHTGTFNIMERPNGDVVKAVATETDSQGYIEVYIADEETALLDTKTYAYALELTDSAGDIERLLFGQLQVRQASHV